MYERNLSSYRKFQLAGCLLLVLSVVSMAWADAPPPGNFSGDDQPNWKPISPDEASPPQQPATDARPRRGKHNRGWPDRPFFDQLSEEDLGKAREFLETYFPERSEELRRLEQSNEPLFKKRLQKMLPRIFKQMRELEQDEELGMLGIEEDRTRMEIRQHCKTYRKTSNTEEREEIRNRLKELISSRFDLQQQRSERTIGKLQARLERLRRQLERRFRERERLVAEELEMRLNPDQSDKKKDKSRRRGKNRRNGGQRGPGPHGQYQGQPGPPPSDELR